MALVASPLTAEVISSGGFDVGIASNGELYDGGTGIGFRRNADGYDPLAPGTPRDSWGISTPGGDAFGDASYLGVAGVAGVVAGPGFRHITTTFGVDILMDYKFAAPNVLKIKHTVRGAEVFDFQRNWDLDVAPTPFGENSVGIFHPLGSVKEDSYYGFENPVPAVPYAFPCGPGGCNATGDLGGGIKISSSKFGNQFTYCYAISQDGQSMLGLVEQAFKLGCRHMIATQSLENGQFGNLGANSALMGIMVPEPGTWAMLIAGFGFVGAAARRRRAVAATA
jgi:hypothetical protein